MTEHTLQRVIVSMIFSLPMDANTVVLTIGMIVGLVVYWKKGGNQASSDANVALKQVADAQKMEIEQLKERVTVCEGLHRENLSEVGRLKGVSEEKDKRIAILESVDITRNPSFLDFMQKLTKTSTDTEVFMMTFKDLPQVMMNINASLQSITDHLAKHA